MMMTTNVNRMERARKGRRLLTTNIGHHDSSDQQLGQTEDLEEAITCSREELNLCPLGSVNRSLPLNNLANALYRHYEQSSRMKDLEDVITCYQKALDLCPVSNLNPFLLLNNVANVVICRYDQLGRMEDLEEAITCSHEALNLCPVDSVDRSLPLNNFASVVLRHYEQSGRSRRCQTYPSSCTYSLIFGYFTWFYSFSL